MRSKPWRSDRGALAMEPGLGAYVLKRLGFAALMLTGVSVILFVIMRLAPGGTEAVLIGGDLSQDAADPPSPGSGSSPRPAVRGLGECGPARRSRTLLQDE